MGGGLMQIVANGAHDVYLTGNPQITFFKAVYRRHTNFSIESIKQTFNGTPNFGQSVSSTISRNADLIGRMYFQTTLPEINISHGILASDNNTKYKAFRWLNYIGHILIKKIEISIGGELIDRHTGEWLHIWNELTQSSGKKNGYSEMVGNVPKLTQIYNSNTNIECKTDPYTLYIPLQFWFCRNPGMALPLIALQYSDISINLELRELDECIWATEQIINNPPSVNDYKPVNKGINVIDKTIQLKSSNIYVDYIYLDTDERRRFAQVPHEYLIEQLQITGEESISSINQNLKLNFTHPVKEIIWVVQPPNFIDKQYTQSRGGRQYFNYSDLWDYSGFTGTPESNFGTGMVGGKGNQNLLMGLSPVKVEGELNINNSWAKTVIDSTNREKSGYNNVKHYTNLNSFSKPNTRKGLWSLLTNTNLMDNGINPITEAKITLNGNPRFSEREGKYFNLVQPYQHHTNCPAIGINVYSFAITPEDHQPSGTCNFSRIDNASLEIKITANTINEIYNTKYAKIRIYAINYNILRIMSGMGGLAYSN